MLRITSPNFALFFMLFYPLKAKKTRT